MRSVKSIKFREYYFGTSRFIKAENLDLIKVMDYLITLVHGTFAPKAPWTMETSNFCKKLQAAIGEENHCEFAVFGWTGQNSHIARFNAADKLAILLTDQLKSHPTKKKIIISHSHGGNISMYALKKLGVCKNEFKLVTMATPFLNSSVRNYSRNIDTHLILLSFLCGFIVFILMIMMGVWLFEHVKLGSFEGYKILLIFPFMAGVMSYCFDFGQKRYKFLKEKSLGLPADLQILEQKLALQDDSCNYPMLSVVDHSDEVKLWFGNLYRFWEFTLNVYDGLASLIKVIAAVVVCCFGGVIVVYLLTGENSTASDLALKITLGFWYALGFLAFGIPLFTFVIPCLFLLIRSNPAVLGWENWKSQFFIKTTPSTTPLGYQNLTFIQYDMKRDGLFSLKHSIYEHDLVISNLAKWIVR